MKRTTNCVSFREGTRDERRSQKLPPQRGFSIPGNDDRSAAGSRLRLDGLAHCPCGVDARAWRIRRVEIWQGLQTVTDNHDVLYKSNSL